MKNSFSKFELIDKIMSFGKNSDFIIGYSECAYYRVSSIITCIAKLSSYFQN